MYADDRQCEALARERGLGVGEIGRTDGSLIGEETAKAFHGRRDSGEEHRTALRDHGESYSFRAPFRYP